MCNIQTLKYQAGIADLKKVLQLEPANQQVKLQLDSTQKLVRRIEFEKVRMRASASSSPC
jgi:serine/threonine-protein phosphatase 5